MFGSGSTTSISKPDSDSKPESSKSPSPETAGGAAPSASASATPTATPSSTASKSSTNADANANASTSPPGTKSPDQAASGEKRSGNGSPPGRQDSTTDKKRRSSGVGSKASSLLASAKNSLSFGQGGRSNSDMAAQTPLQKLGKQDPALVVPQGQHNNSAGESAPGQRSTFRVGVWEDRNKKCRRTMEDTHAFLYNFLPTPAPTVDAAGSKDKLVRPDSAGAPASTEMIETDNGYFAIFDGHAGTFAADWCGKKLHLILEDTIRKNPNVPIPELLDMSFTAADSQLEKLPSKNSGCTAAIAVLRWEDRVPSDRSVTGSQAIAPATAAAAKAVKTPAEDGSKPEENGDTSAPAATPQTSEAAHAKLKGTATRQRVLYTANVGDARIILCRGGKALRLSYDHKGSDENEGKRIANAGGLILNNRVNGVLAVTRALGDSYMKDLVTGHPYTTETVIQPDSDEFIIIACDGLWDVCSDQEAVDLVRDIQDPFAASKLLVDHALNRFSTDNLSCLIVRFDKAAVIDSQSNKIGVEGDAPQGKVSEADKILRDTKQKIDGGDTPAIGVSATNTGRGRDVINREDSSGFKPTMLDGSVEEEPASYDENENENEDKDGEPDGLEPEKGKDKDKDPEKKKPS